MVRLRCAMPALLLAAVFLAASGAAQADVGVATYHNDNYRTGWNPDETVLDARSVAGNKFKLIKAVKLDGQIDAQPLIVANQKVGNHSARDVAYIVTETDFVYAIDAASGRILAQRQLGTAVPGDSLPGGCNNNAPIVGIDSTPVIDTATGIIYVIADTYNASTGNAKYRLHALSLATLADTMPAVTVTASGTLSNGKTYRFNASVSRLRAALLLSRGNVYAGFASYCDESADQTRGWVLGWNASSLAPLAGNELTDMRAHSTDNYFLSSVWMSGYGLAADPSGNVYFVTGNSDYSGDSYNAVENIAESAASVSPDLSTVNGVFTPSDWSQLDNYDEDFGSGGLMLLPPQSGQPDLAVAAGKDGNLYLLNADSMAAINSYQIGGCWCGQSYYTGADGLGRVVTGGGNYIGIWKVKGTKNPSLGGALWSSVGVDNGQDPGVFTSISSNGSSNDASVVIWAVGHPTDNYPAKIELYAFDRRAHLLFVGTAGSWPNTGGNANIVPTVANGHVYVASYGLLAIFGLSSGPAAALPVNTQKPYRPALASNEHEVYGKIRSVNGADIVIARRNGRLLSIDASDAIRAGDYARPMVGRALIARGTYAPSGVMQARYVLHAKSDPALWLPDR
jgi:hypothetical protein